MFHLSTTDPHLAQIYDRIALKYKEKFYLLYTYTKVNESSEANHQKSVLTAIGYNFTKTFNVVHLKHNPKFSEMMFIKAIQESQSQDLLFWNM